MSAVAQLQRMGVQFVRLLPENLLDWLARRIGLVSCYLLKTKREYIYTNLTHIFHDRKLTQREMNCLVKSTFMNFARAMIDFFRLRFITRNKFSVECFGFENVIHALDKGQGCVLITAHVGNWDYAGAYLAAFDVPMNALVEVTDPEMYELYTRHREHTGMKTFALDRAGYAFVHTIKANRVLAVLADRDIMKTGTVVEFFDAKRKIPRGLGDIIIKRNMPVVFAYMVLHPYSQEKRYLAVIERPVEFSGDVQSFNTWLVKNLEQLIRKYPDQWFVFHPEWID